MTAVNLSAPSTATSANMAAAQTVSPAKPENISATTLPTAQNGGDTVTISGHAMLLSRLFHTGDTQAQPPVKTILTTQDLSGNTYSFLSMDDRKLLERAYEYASANSLDPKQVDGLAFDLSLYRHMQVSGSTAEVTGLFDMEGNPWVGKFNTHDTELAKRMLTSQAINETDMDKGFLAYMLNPQRNQGHAVSFESLEKFISALSPSGGKTSDTSAAQPLSQPADRGFAQALNRIDHPYVGVKLDMSQFRPENRDDQQQQHLSKTDRNRMMAVYQFALLQGSQDRLKTLGQMTTLADIVRMWQDGSLSPRNH